MKQITLARLSLFVCLHTLEGAVLNNQNTLLTSLGVSTSEIKEWGHGVGEDIGNGEDRGNGEDGEYGEDERTGKLCGHSCEKAIADFGRQICSATWENGCPGKKPPTGLTPTSLVEEVCTKECGSPVDTLASKVNDNENEVKKQSHKAKATGKMGELCGHSCAKAVADFGKQICDSTWADGCPDTEAPDGLTSSSRVSEVCAKECAKGYTLSNNKGWHPQANSNEAKKEREEAPEDIPLRYMDEESAEGEKEEKELERTEKVRVRDTEKPEDETVRTSKDKADSKKDGRLEANSKKEGGFGIDKGLWELQKGLWKREAELFKAQEKKLKDIGQKMEKRMGNMEQEIKTRVADGVEKRVKEIEELSEQRMEDHMNKYMDRRMKKISEWMNRLPVEVYNKRAQSGRLASGEDTLLTDVTLPKVVSGKSSHGTPNH